MGNGGGLEMSATVLTYPKEQTQLFASKITNQNTLFSVASPKMVLLYKSRIFYTGPKKVPLSRAYPWGRAQGASDPPF